MHENARAQGETGSVGKLARHNSPASAEMPVAGHDARRAAQSTYSVPRMAMNAAALRGLRKANPASALVLPKDKDAVSSRMHSFLWSSTRTSCAW
jgi:hypothetical protein